MVSDGPEISLPICIVIVSIKAWGVPRNALPIEFLTCVGDS